MLQEKNRANNAEIILVKEEGRLVSGSYLGILVYNLGGGEPTKFGVIVSTKVHKKSTKRNRIKRLIHEGIRLNLDRIKNGQLVLVLAKKNLLEKKLEEIKSEIETILEKAGLLK